MSSVVYYKFLHQKNRSVIHFDGTAINVFDLKREIILQNQLGAGNDFILRLYHSEQPDLEYELDQDVIPRSSFVLAKRSPCNFKGGRFGNASRYISGKPRVNRKVINNATASAASQPIRTDQAPMDENMSEEDRIKMMFESQDNVWAQAQDELATHKMVYNKPGQAKAEDLPPPGYICYRCGKKDHWIKNCPTNTDPTFEGKKILRTTGIPKSYLKTISKEELERRMETEGLQTNENGDMVDKDGNAILVTEDGGYAIAMADSKTWLSYQEKQQNAALKAKQEFEQKIVECIVGENRLEFLNPLSATRSLLKAPIVMTPCCKDKSSLKNLANYNYNQAELEQKLIENDFHCPNCGKEDVYIDSFIPNKELEEELAEYMKQKQTELGIEDPETSLKRAAEEDGDNPELKRQKAEMTMRPDMFPPPGMPPFMPGMQMPGMPPMPMFMPPVPMPPQNGNGGNGGGK